MRIARARDEVSLSPWLGAAARVAGVVECVRFGRIPLSDRSPPSLTPRSRTRGRLCFTSRPFSWSSCSEAKQHLRQDVPLRQPRACKARSHRTVPFPRRPEAVIKEHRRCQNRRRCSWWVAGSLAWPCHGVAGAPCREVASPSRSGPNHPGGRRRPSPQRGVRRRMRGQPRFQLSGRGCRARRRARKRSQMTIAATLSATARRRAAFMPIAFSRSCASSVLWVSSTVSTVHGAT